MIKFKYLLIGLYLCTSLSGMAQTNTDFYCHFSIPNTPEPFVGTPLVATDDATYGPFPIGFTFNFFGTNYTQYYVGTNGWVGFTPNQPNTYTGTFIPNTGATVPKNCIMGPWEDWDPSVGAGPYIFRQLSGTAPNRMVTVSWLDCPMFQCNSNLGTFQIVMHEGTNWIDNHLMSKPSCPSWVSGSSVWGLHNAPGTLAYVVNGQNGAPWTTNNESIRYVPELEIMTYLDQEPSDNLDPSMNMPCSTNVIKILLNSPFLCSTPDKNASNFRFFDPDNVAVGLDSSYTSCDALGYGDTLYVRIADKLYKEGTYVLYSKKGDDGNSVLGNCKDNLKDFDTLYVNIQDCYNYNGKPKLLTVSTLSDNKQTQIFWERPKDLDSTFFASYELLKNNALNSPTFSSLLKTYNINDTIAVDQIIDAKTEDRAYKVVVNLNISNKKSQESDTIANILLQNPDGMLANQDIAATTAQLTWNNYWGWNNPKYKIQEAEINNNIVWKNIDSTTNTSYNYTKQKKNGTYGLRILTTRNNAPKYLCDTSISNYLVYISPIRDVTIPDIFTPNGDNINEAFVIKNLEFYPKAKLAIYNRWGGIIYNSTDYKNDWTGENHPAGIYYYTLEAADLETKSGAVKMVK